MTENSFSWSNIFVNIRRQYKLHGVLSTLFLDNETKRNQKVVLRSNSGHVNSGDFLAVIGPSGCGKTTLLNCLAMRVPSSLKMRGRVYFNERRVTQSTAKYICSYVPQEDAFYEQLTVEEHLRFQAGLRLSKLQSSENREDSVEQVMILLGLDKKRNTRIGHSLIHTRDGLSHGERKRLVFATELLSDFPVLLVDEPTSGLDSHMATIIMKLLRDASRLGKIVIVTVHQPSSQAFKFIDKILLMSDGIKIMLGTKIQALHLFERCGFLVPENYNPADWFLSNINISHGKNREHDQRRKVIFLAEMWLLYFQEEMPQESKEKVLKLKHHRRSGIWNQIRFITSRQLLLIFKNLQSFNMAAYQFIFAIAIGLLFLGDAEQKYRRKSIEATATGIGIYLLVCALGYLATPSLAVGFDKVVTREIHSGLYNVFVYYACIYFVELIIIFLECLPGFTILYFMIGLHPRFELWGDSYFNLFLMNWQILGLGHLLANILRNESRYFHLALPLGMVFILFSNIIIKIKGIPYQLKFISWICPPNRALMGIVATQFGIQVEVDCDSGINPEDIIRINDTICIYDGLTFVDEYDTEGTNRGDFYTAESTFGVVCRIVAVVISYFMV